MNYIDETELTEIMHVFVLVIHLNFCTTASCCYYFASQHVKASGIFLLF